MLCHMSLDTIYILKESRMTKLINLVVSDCLYSKALLDILSYSVTLFRRMYKKELHLELMSFHATRA